MEQVQGLKEYVKLEQYRKALGLPEPSTLADVEQIVRMFRENDPGGNGNIGLPCVATLYGDGSSNFSVDPVFSAFHAYPGIWLQDGDDGYVYGSLTEETRQALVFLREWYETGILDQDYMMRTPGEIGELIRDNRCGAFFGWWWAPNNPLLEAVEANPGAEWKPYVIADEHGEVRSYIYGKTSPCIVVRKGYEHPEIVAKYVSAIFDQSRYAKDSAAREVNDYFSINVDPTARPLNINVDYEDALYRTTEHIQAALDKTLDVSELSGLEKSYFNTCKSYLNGQLTTANGWAAYASRIQAVGELQKAGITSTSTLPLENVNAEIPQELQELEQEAFLQIISGEKPVDYFDTFVIEWYANGGKVLTERVQNAYESGKN